MFHHGKLGDSLSALRSCSAAKSTEVGAGYASASGTSMRQVCLDLLNSLTHGCPSRLELLMHRCETHAAQSMNTNLADHEAAGRGGGGGGG